MRCQNCGSMFFCHIAIWVLHMEHIILVPFRRVIESLFCVSATFFFKSDWSAVTRWPSFLLFNHPFIVFVRAIKQKIECGRVTA